jgi:hypothetical protein
MTFLLGRHATFGHEPPTSARSTTMVFSPWLARGPAKDFACDPAADDQVLNVFDVHEGTS